MMQSLLITLVLAFSTSVFAENNPVIILYSDNNESYHAPANAFKKKQSSRVIEYYLKGDSLASESAVMDSIMAEKPSIIFALGARAAWFSKTATMNHLETKVIFAMVINWKRYNLLDGQSNITGISSEISPGTQLFNLSLISPKIQRVGVIFSKSYSDAMIVKAKAAAELLGLEIVAEPINRAGAFQRTWRKISQDIDAYWVLADPVLYTLENVHWLNNRCLREKIICIGQSSNITKLGVLLSINPDEENLGVQAAALSARVQEPSFSHLFGQIQDPIATKVTFNRNTARKIGIKVNSLVLSLVNDVVE